MISRSQVGGDEESHKLDGELFPIWAGLNRTLRLLISFPLAVVSAGPQTCSAKVTPIQLPQKKRFMELFSKLLSHGRVGGSLHIVALGRSSEYKYSAVFGQWHIFYYFGSALQHMEFKFKQRVRLKSSPPP